MIRKYKGIVPKIDESCFIADTGEVIGDVEIGKNSSVWFNAVLRGDINKIIVGENTNFQEGSVVHNTRELKAIIGNNVTVGHGAILHGCTIGDNCLIGMGAIVLNGAKVGNNCLIGAGAMVTPNTVIPDGYLVLGSPAKPKRLLSEDEINSMVTNVLEYVTLSKEYKDEVMGYR